MPKQPINAPAPSTPLGQQLKEGRVRYVDFRPVGATGLNLTSGGYLLDEKVRALQGQRGMEMYKEMEADSTIGNCLNIIERTARQASYTIEPVSQSDRDIDAAQFLETCLDDMDLTFSDILADQIRGITQYGFYLGALQYKRRAGKSPEPHLNSRFADGRIGWQGIMGLAQETITRWYTDEQTGSFTAVEQNAPPLYRFEKIPYERLLHIRQSTHKNSPIGTSMIRCVFKDYFLKTRLENFMAIGAERAAVGLPVMGVPESIAAALTPEDSQILDSYKQIVTRLGTHEDQGMVRPLAYDQNGKELYTFELISSDSSHLGQLLDIIRALDSRIAEALQSEFTKLGELSQGGSYAMHADKTDMHSEMINNLLSCVEDAFNRFAIPRLFEANDFNLDELPKLKFDPVGETNTASVAAFLQACAGAGAQFFPNPDLEDKLLSMVGLPPMSRNLDNTPDLPPLQDTGPKEEQEIHPGDVTPVGANEQKDNPNG